MSDYVDVLGVDDVVPGGMTDVEASGETVLLARVGDTFYASQARCPHMRGPLAKGTLEGTVLTCPWHGSQFDLTDGHVVRWTGWTGVIESIGDVIRHPRPLKIYATRVENGRVLVGPSKNA